MKKFSFYTLIVIFLASCQQHDFKTISVKGNIKNAAKNKISLIPYKYCTIDSTSQVLSSIEQDNKVSMKNYLRWYRRSARN